MGDVSLCSATHRCTFTCTHAYIYIYIFTCMSHSWIHVHMHKLQISIHTCLCALRAYQNMCAYAPASKKNSLLTNLLQSLYTMHKHEPYVSSYRSAKTWNIFRSTTSWTTHSLWASTSAKHPHHMAHSRHQPESPGASQWQSAPYPKAHLKTAFLPRQTSPGKKLWETTVSLAR